jgi:hypothetical protein
MEQTWTENEIKDLILYAKGLQEDNETLRAQLIAMNAKLENEERKTTRLTNMLKTFTNGNNFNYSN